jgi:hypothetical protein
VTRSTAPRILTIVSAVAMIVSGIGFVAALMLNAFVFDEYNAYGEVPIPGRGTVHLPAGEVNVSFHTQIIGSTNGGGLPIPNLRWRADPPSGVAEPQVTEDIGSTTTVNNDARVRVWVARIAEEGDYRISTDGNVSAFLSPRLAFGHGSPVPDLPWWLAAVFAVAVLDLIIARVWAAKVRRRPTPVGLMPTFTIDAGPAYTPSDDGVRIQQLKTLAALRDSGALTQAEFDAEKRRLLGS